MNSLKHSISLADICTSRSSYAALKLGSLVGNNITVKVRKNKNLKVFSSCRVDKLSGGDVNVPVICYDVGILLTDFLCGIKEFTVGSLNNISLCNDRNLTLMVTLGIIISKLCDSVTTFLSCNGKINCKVVGNINTVRTDCIATLGIFSKESQSMPCSGTFTGLIFAKRSSSLRIATLALSTFGHGSP